MRHMAFLFCVLLAAAASAAAQPKVVNSFSTTQFGSTFPGGLGYDTIGDYLYVADETGKKIYQVTRTGTMKTVIDGQALGMTNPIGAGVDYKGQLLYIADEKTTAGERVWALDMRNGFVVVTMGVLGPTTFDVSGLDYNPISNRIVSGSDGPGMIYEFDLNFQSVSSISLPASITDADGLGINTYNGLYLVGDDTNKLLYEIAPDGWVMNSYTTTSFGVNNPEGICMDPGNGNYFISTTVAPQTVYEVAGGLTLGPALTSDLVTVPVNTQVTITLRTDTGIWPIGGIALISPAVIPLNINYVGPDGTISFRFTNPPSGLGGLKVTLLGAGLNSPGFALSNQITIAFN